MVKSCLRVRKNVYASRFVFYHTWFKSQIFICHSKFYKIVAFLENRNVHYVSEKAKILTKKLVKNNLLRW